MFDHKIQQDTIMSDSESYLDNLWSALLSRDAQMVLSAFDSLNAEERKSVQAHLLRMTQESGWLPEQRISAQTALKILSKNTKQV